MNPGYHIHYLKRQEIDIARWDACIDSSPNGLIYGRSFFLDAMTAGQWDALVTDDYKMVMPLTWKKKFGFRYLYQPVFMTVLGVFGQATPEPPLSAFLRSIPARFRYWDIDLHETSRLENNEMRLVPGVEDSRLSFAMTSRLNYFLDLHRSYEDIREHYKRLARRMLKKAGEEGLNVVRQVRPAEVIEHYLKAYGKKLPQMPDKIFRRLTACADIAGLSSHNASARPGANVHADTYLAQSPDGEVAAFYLVFSDDRYVYSTLGGSTAAGKEKGAFYLLTDAVIRDHAGDQKIFRFEGSDIPGIAFFNALFGPIPVHYPHLTLNRLPFPVNLLK
jgi:hypothetical protein